jgi:Carboxypeptidase regulatory-like domain
MCHNYHFKLIAVSLTLIFLAITAQHAGAQSGSTGAITGTVEDQKGGAIAGADVAVIKQDTGETVRQVKTSASGAFTVSLLQPSTYSVEVTAPGFAKFVAGGILVRVTETASVTAQLQLGNVTTTVTVEGAATAVDLTSPTTGQTVTSETVNDLPLSTRNFLTLLTLSAGANTELFNNASLGRGEVTMNVDGARPSDNNYELEGINANDFNLPINDHVALPNPDTIEEFKAQTSLYDASNGRNAGGNTQVDLKSGTDRYHGDAYEYFRNEDFNANDWFLKNEDEPRPELRQNQFGATFGGPVPAVHNFFFFMGYQGTREISGAGGAGSGTSVNTTLPILPTTRTETTLVDDFFGGTLPAGYASIDPVALAYLNLPAKLCPGFNDGTFCIPTLPGTPGLTAGTINTATIVRSLPGTFDDDQFVVTVDKQVDTQDKLSARVFFSDNNTLEPFGTGVTLPFALGNPGSNRFIKTGWTRIIGNNIVNNARFGFSRYTFDQTPSEPLTLTDIGATRPNAATIPAAYELNVTGGGAFSIGTGVNDVRSGAFNTFVIGDDVSITHGKHAFRFGGEWNKYQLNRSNPYASRGEVTFANTTGAPCGTETGFQDFLLGCVDTTAGQAGFSTFHFRDADPALYFLDDWKITHRLTLNLGLRWEGLAQSHETNNFMSNFLGNGDSHILPPLEFIHPAGTPGGIGTPGVSNCTFLHCMDKKDFAPRVGFAWDPLGDQKTVVSGGFGIYYDRISNQTLLQSGGGFPFNESIQATPGTVTPENPFAGLPPDSDFPLTTPIVVPSLTGFNAATGAPIFTPGSGAADGALNQFFFFGNRGLHAPYVEQWNFGVERELANRWVLGVRYVGSHGVDLVGTGAPADPGQICTEAAPCVIPAAVGSGVSVPAGTPFVTKNADGSIDITGSTVANLDARVPVRYLGLQNSAGFFQLQQGNSIYHSLQVTLSHQFSKGLYLQSAYTWSHSIDDGSGSSFTDELDGNFGYENLLDPRSQRGSSDFDRTHRWVTSYDYALPFGKWAHLSDSGVLGRLVNGWSINGVTTLQSGTPFIILDSSALTLQDLDGINGTNFATLAAGMTLRDALNAGSVESQIRSGIGYLNLGAFNLGGNCVDSQNSVLGPAIMGSCSPYPTAVGAAFGDVKRNSLRGPFQQNWDMSIFKNTRITEGTMLQFRVEAFNVFNHPSFQSPQAGFGQGFSFFGNYGYVNIANGSGAITGTASTPRILQLALKFMF